MFPKDGTGGGHMPEGTIVGAKAAELEATCIGIEA